VGVQLEWPAGAGPDPYTLHPTPYTLNPKHQTPNTKHQTPNTKHQNPKHQTPNTKHQTPNTKHHTGAGGRVHDSKPSPRGDCTVELRGAFRDGDSGYEPPFLKTRFSYRAGHCKSALLAPSGMSQSKSRTSVNLSNSGNPDSGGRGWDVFAGGDGGCGGGEDVVVVWGQPLRAARARGRGGARLDQPPAGGCPFVRGAPAGRRRTVAPKHYTPTYLRLIDSCITQLKAQGPSRTCNESKSPPRNRFTFQRSSCS